MRLKKDITSLDPAFIVDVDGGKVAAYLYNGLVKLDKNLNIVADIAKKWEILDNGRRYRFYLRDDVCFSNNLKCTAKIVKKSFERIIDPDISSPRTWVFEKVKGVQDVLRGSSKNVAGFVVVNDNIFDIVLTEPFLPFLSMLTISNALVVIADDKSKNIYGTGPFILDYWDRGNRLVLRRNKNYFGKKAEIKQIQFKIIPEDFTAITEFENGKIDVFEIPRAEFEYFVNDKIWKNYVHEIPALNTYYLGFNCQKTPYSDKKFRKAVAASINRKKIVENYLESRVETARCPVPPALLNKQIVIDEKIEYNPSYALELLKTFDKNKTPIKLYLSSNREMEGVAELIQHDLNAVGIDVDIHVLEWTAFKETVANGEAGMFLLSWWADYPDIENFLYPVFHSDNWGAAGNRVRYKNKRFNVLVEKARASVDENMRNQLYSQAVNIVMDDCPWVCLWHKKKFTVTQPWIKNYFLSPLYSVDKGNKIQIEKIN
ncbi:ABC transporter substrate-binding protein [bacterium]|nr:ABC transporter substrate-binding protein [bacterium]